MSILDGRPYFVGLLVRENDRDRGASTFWLYLKNGKWDAVMMEAEGFRSEKDAEDAAAVAMLMNPRRINSEVRIFDWRAPLVRDRRSGGVTRGGGVL